MARYSCNYTAPSTTGENITSGTFCGSLTGSVTGNICACNYYCIWAQQTYSAENYITVACCTSWSHSSVNCFLIPMCGFTDVSIDISACSCTSLNGMSLFVLNCSSVIHCDASTSLPYIFAWREAGGAYLCCFNSICACTCGKNSFRINFYSTYNHTCTTGELIGFEVQSLPYLVGGYSNVWHGGRIGYVQPATSTGSAFWSTFNGFALCTGISSGTGSYSIRARPRRS